MQKIIRHGGDWDSPISFLCSEYPPGILSDATLPNLGRALIMAAGKVKGQVRSLTSQAAFLMV